jgi:hypothetical protein
MARFSPLLEGIPPGMARTLLVSQLAAHLGVSEGDVKAHLVAEARPPPRAAPRPAPAAKSPTLSAADAMFAALLVTEPSFLDTLEGRFVHLLRPALRVLLESGAGAAELGELDEGLRKPIEQCLAAIAQTLTTPDLRRRALCDSSLNLRLDRLEERRRETALELSAAEAAGADGEEIERLQRENIEANAERKRLKERTPRPSAPSEAAAGGGAA